MEIKFLADEHIDLDAVISLQKRGVAIVSINQTNLRGKSDSEIIEYAKKFQMAIVTRDKDFLGLAKSIPHNGIVYLTKQLNAGAIVRELEKISLIYRNEDIVGQVVYMPLR